MTATECPSRRLLTRLGLLLLLAWPGLASAWWNDEWPYRAPIAVDTSAGGAAVQESLDSVTVLVKLHAGNFQDFFLLDESLADLRFVDGDDVTPLKHHVEHFDMINQMAWIWVKVPKVVGNINTGRLWMYYGNAEAVAAADLSGSYDDATALVYHFNADDPLPQDRSAYGNHAAQSTAAVIENSVIGPGLQINGAGHVTVAGSPSLALDPENGQTVSFWVMSEDAYQEAVLMERSGAAGALRVAMAPTGIYADFESEDGSAAIAPAPALGAATWHHVTLTIDATSMTLSVDGNPVGSTEFSVPALDGDIALGSGLNGARPFVGEIDEFRIDNTVRSDGWKAMVTANQGLDASLLRVQQAEQLGSGGGGTNFWRVIVQSTESSGWAIVALLGVMATVSWLVMIGKALFLRSVSRDNENFLSQYQALGDGDPAMLDHDETAEDKELADSPMMQAIFGKHDHFQSSPLFRIYHRAISQTQARLGRAAGAQRTGLSVASVAAIRASIDAQVVREVQRLNSKMVLLTIAIAGGPFLGLLGTVVGVMITFAAIAVTGDVNISAIAPGVAAALLTTVAGLFVAIPALFGYNYLATRIKEVIADMRIFTDEFVTRLAEYYGSGN